MGKRCTATSRRLPPRHSPGRLRCLKIRSSSAGASWTGSTGPWTSGPATAPFSIALRDGSFIYGDLVSVSDDSISIRSIRHGDTVLKRSEVLSVRRVRRGSLLFSGPTGDVGWQSMMNQQDGNVSRNQNQPGVTPPLTTGPGGALLIRAWNRSALLDITLPDLVDVEFRIHSSKRPEFLLALGGNVRQSLRVETWDDELVLATGDEFKAIRKIEGNEREVALRVCWDQKAQKCSVFNPAGELITAWQVPPKKFRLAQRSCFAKQGPRSLARFSAGAELGRKTTGQGRPETTARGTRGRAQHRRGTRCGTGGLHQVAIAGTGRPGHFCAGRCRCARRLLRRAAGRRP